MSDNKQVEVTNKIRRLASQSATSNVLESHQKQDKTRIPIEDIPAGWKTNLAKTNKFQNASLSKQVDNP